jgi:cutinase
MRKNTQQEYKYKTNCIWIALQADQSTLPQSSTTRISQGPPPFHYSLHSMKFRLLTVALLSGALAAPAPISDAEAFPIDELLVSKLAPEEHALSKRQYSSSTYNQLTDGTACRAISLIYARGTGQQGNVGDAAAVGPLFFNQLASRVGGTSRLAIQGVTYSASVSGFLQGGDPTGSTTMTNLISTVS